MELSDEQKEAVSGKEVEEGDDVGVRHFTEEVGFERNVAVAVVIGVALTRNALLVDELDCGLVEKCVKSECTNVHDNTQKHSHT